MKLLILLYLSFSVNVALFASDETDSEDKADQRVECPCPHGINDECTMQSICVYGVNDNGEIFHNGKNDEMELTKIALDRKAEINNTDDVLVNLYNPQIRPMAIFYYGCQRCDDLKEMGNFTVPKLRIFLLSLYNQRMKYNIKYSQSDFVFYIDSENEQQPMPEISVRPFWKNRLMFNQSCAHKQQSFTQKHFIPAFLTQDLCILDYKNVSRIQNNQTHQIVNGVKIYSPTLSYIDLYSFNVLSNSSNEIPASHYSGEHEMCKMTFNLKSNMRSVRFFCLCPTNSCTLKVTQKDPLHCCPYQMNITFSGASEYSSLNQTSDYMPVDQFFLQSANTYCYFRWAVKDVYNAAFIQRLPFSMPGGYVFDPTYSLQERWFCPFFKYEKIQIEPIYVSFYKNNTRSLHDAFLKATIDHSKIVGDIESVGANCSSEGPLSHPSYSTSYGSNSEMFPCYKYFAVASMSPIFPLMGINIIPIKIIAKGKKCYYYVVKAHKYHVNACNQSSLLLPILTIAGCRENDEIDLSEVARMKRITNACPTMKPGETKWKYEATANFPSNLCGQFLRGVKLVNGKYVPEEIELRQIYDVDFGMIGSNQVYHGCGFNASQKLTICTCISALGGCENLYIAGRVHLLRYLPFKDV